MRCGVHLKTARAIQTELIESGELRGRKAQIVHASPTETREEKQAADLAVVVEAGQISVRDFGERRGLIRTTAKKRMNDLRKVGKAAPGAKIEGSGAALWSATP